MRKFLPAFAIFAIAATPALAQTAPVPGQPAPAKVKMVKKKVCQKVTADRDTGSRLSASNRVCKVIEVPAEPEAKDAHSTQPQGHNANAH